MKETYPMTPHFLVLGELNADLILTNVEALPQFGREFVAEGFSQVMGSSSAITAIRLRALGTHVSFGGWVGDDAIGNFVLDQLSAANLGTEHVHVRSDGSTGVTVIMTGAEDRAMLTYPGLMTAYDGSDITAEVLARHTHLHVGSFFLQEALQPRLTDLFTEAHRHGLTTSLDVGWDPTEQWHQNPYLWPVLAQTDYFLPNETEALHITGEQDIAHVAQRVGGLLVIKRGKHGGTAYVDGEAVVSEAFAVERVVDTTGAGDAFNAGFLYAAHVRESSIADALRFANACGAHAVGFVGGTTNAPDAEMIDGLL
jgi:sugar/nucleoside kinase (ribokinase family)